MLDMTFEQYMGEPFRMWHNDNDLSDYFYVLEVTGRSLSPNEIRSITVSGVDGSYYRGKRKPSIPLKVKVMLTKDSDSNLRTVINTLNGILDTDEEVPIIFGDEPTMTYYGILSSVDESKEVNGNHIVTITFFRSKPRKFGKEVTRSFTNGVLTLTNNGTAEAMPIIDITMDVASSDLVISNGIETLRVIYSLVIGDTLEINFKQRKVYINGVLQMTAVDLNNPTFFSLEPGENELTITPATTATVFYEEAWL